MSGLQVYNEAVRAIKEAILQVNIVQFLLLIKSYYRFIMALAKISQKTPAKVFGVKAQLKQLAYNCKMSCLDFVVFRLLISNLCVNSMRRGAMI